MTNEQKLNAVQILVDFCAFVIRCLVNLITKMLRIDYQDKQFIQGVFMKTVKGTDANEIGTIGFVARDSEGSLVKDFDASGVRVEDVTSDNEDSVRVVFYDAETRAYEFEYIAPDEDGEPTIANVSGEITNEDGDVIGFVAEQYVVTAGDVDAVVGSFNSTAPTA